MPVQGDVPYGSFSYLVTITPEEGNDVLGGFPEVSGLSTEVTYADYREGTGQRNGLRKLPLTSKAGDVTLKRGLIAGPDVRDWTELVRTGYQRALATVVIELKSEDKRQTVATWRLIRAWPSKWTGSMLAAQGGRDVPVEER